MSQVQFYSLFTTIALLAIACLGSIVATLATNSRLNDMIGRLGRMEGTLNAVCRDISDVKRDIRGHNVEIANLKERLK